MFLSYGGDGEDVSNNCRGFNSMCDECGSWYCQQEETYGANNKP